MTALTGERNTTVREGRKSNFPMAAATKVWAGSMAALDASGNVVKAATATTLTAIGRAEETVDNTGAAAAKNIEVVSGVFRWVNSAAGDAITKAEIGDICYMADDQTVAKTDGGSTRSRAGLIMDVDSIGVWVLQGVGPAPAAAGGLLAANNLSDLGTVASARSNLGVSEKQATATFVIGAEAANVINVGVQLNEADGTPLAVRGAVQAYLSDDANGDSIAATAPDGGVVIGTDGVAIPVVAGKAFQLTSEADGDIDLDITEAGGATWYLIIVLPDGTLVPSGAITFA